MQGLTLFTQTQKPALLLSDFSESGLEKVSLFSQAGFDGGEFCSYAYRNSYCISQD